MRWDRLCNQHTINELSAEVGWVGGWGEVGWGRAGQGGAGGAVQAELSQEPTHKELRV